MTHNLQRPLARYLSSFAYRLSVEHPGIIKPRYLSSRRMYETLRPPLGRFCKRHASRRKMCYNPASRILHGLPARYRSRHSRRAARQVLDFGSRPVDRSPCRMSECFVLGEPRRFSGRSSPLRGRGGRRPWCVVPRKTPQSHRTQGAAEGRGAASGVHARER